MQLDRPAPLWAGRTIALLGILLVALSLRQAVAAISPIFDLVRVDIPLSSVAIGVIGMLPPILFAASGLIAPPVARRLGLEFALVAALVLMVVGHLGRATAPNYTMLAVSSVVALLGMGIGNVLLPPAVKRYFPDRIGLVTASYATLLSVSTAVPALLAAPLADAGGWRMSLGVWSLTAAVAIVPWAILVTRHRAEKARAVVDAAVLENAVLEGTAAEETPELEKVKTAVVGRLWRSPVAIAITIAFAVSSLNAYAAFTWLPEILVDITGMSTFDSGIMLSIFSAAGLPASIIAPILVARLKNVGWIVFAGVAFFVVGYLGLIFVPSTATVLWVILAGLGPVLFPVCLVLINSRTRTHEGSVALSGFVQSVGYTLGALGPLVVGLLHDVTGGWTGPLVFLLLTALAGIYAAIALRSERFVEDELAR